MAKEGSPTTAATVVVGAAAGALVFIMSSASAGGTVTAAPYERGKVGGADSTAVAYEGATRDDVCRNARQPVPAQPLTLGMGKTVMVTGAEGCIGSHIAKACDTLDACATLAWRVSQSRT